MNNGASAFAGAIGTVTMSKLSIIIDLFNWHTMKTLTPSHPGRILLEEFMSPSA